MSIQKILGWQVKSPNICSKCTIAGLLSRFNNQMGTSVCIDDTDRFLLLNHLNADEFVAVCYDQMGDWTVQHGCRSINGSFTMCTNNWMLAVVNQPPTDDSVISRLVSQEWHSKPHMDDVDIVEIRSRFNKLTKVMLHFLQCFHF